MYYQKGKGKGKSNPVQAWTGNEDFWRLKFEHFMTRTALRTGPLYPRKSSWYSFLLEAESIPGPQSGRMEVNDTFGNRTRDLPAYSAVPQPTASPPTSCSLEHPHSGTNMATEQIDIYKGNIPEPISYREWMWKLNYGLHLLNSTAHEQCSGSTHNIAI